MPQIFDEREAKLPLWAQQRIDQLRQDLAAAERRILTMMPDAQGESTRMKLRRYGRDADIPIPENYVFVIESPTGDIEMTLVRHRNSYENGSVEVRSGGRGGPLLIRPRSCNVVQVQPEEL